MKKFLIILISLILTAFAGSAEEIHYVAKWIPDSARPQGYEVNGDEKAAEDFIKSQGWQITGWKGKVDEYTLEKFTVDEDANKAIHYNYRYIWSLQKVKTEKYFGKVITVYAFGVRKHPLQWRDSLAKRNGAELFIMISEGKVIGGYTLPNTVSLTGGYYSLYGETWSEINKLYLNQQTGNWERKYDNAD